MPCAELTRVHSVHPVHFDGIFASKKGSEFQESEDSRSATEWAIWRRFVPGKREVAPRRTR